MTAQFRKRPAHIVAFLPQSPPKGEGTVIAENVLLEGSMNLQNTKSSNPRDHTMHIRTAMRELITHLRQDIERVNEPRAQALFETSAEVLEGLVTAFEHYEVGKEVAFKH